MKKEDVAKHWELLVSNLTKQFNADEELDVDGILFLIGVQELGLGPKKFKKDEKINLIHIAICKVLEPYGYYNFKGLDDQGWPHYELTHALPNLKPGEQSVLIKEAIVEYALGNGIIE